MINKMPGLEDDKFANLKAGYTFMTGHPGKKLLFMGQDIGQYREWSEEREIDWFLLEDKKNEHLQAYVRDLLTLYKKYPALYANDTGSRGLRVDQRGRRRPQHIQLCPLVTDRQRQPALCRELHADRAAGLLCGVPLKGELHADS